MPSISTAGALFAYISRLQFKHAFGKYPPGTKSQGETHGFLGRQQGQADSSGQEAAETYLLLAMPSTSWVTLNKVS